MQASRARNIPDLIRRTAVVRPRRRFVVNEVRPQQTLARYRVAGTDLVFHLRHHTADIGAVSGCLVEREYALPPPVARRLAALGRPARIVDLGGHIGLFGVAILRELPDAVLTSVEPDPANAQMLERTVEANGLAGRWRVLSAAAGRSQGTARFVADASMSSHVLRDGGGGSTIEVEVLDAFELSRDADLVKIDIEGAEWDILADARVGELAPAIALEYHAEGCPGGDPGALAERLLAEAGYTVARQSENEARGIGTLWAWREPG